MRGTGFASPRRLMPTKSQLARAWVVLLLAATAHAQAPLAWVGHEAEMEAHLRSAAVERIVNIGVGVTRPRRAFLEPDLPFASMTWKVLPERFLRGHWESYKSEIAAYELDKLLEMHMVPPAVERVISGEQGAAIMWVDDTRSVKDMGGQVPTGPQFGRPIRVMQLFDNLIGNPDRNAGNILVDRFNRVILIDHSRAFLDSDKLPFEFERVDATLWSHVEQLTR